jgi:hypothetical protein
MFINLYFRSLIRFHRLRQFAGVLTQQVAGTCARSVGSYTPLPRTSWMSKLHYEEARLVSTTPYSLFCVSGSSRRRNDGHECDRAWPGLGVDSTSRQSGAIAAGIGSTDGSKKIGLRSTYDKFTTMTTPIQQHG